MDVKHTDLPPGADAPVTALYAEHALGLVRLAVVLTGDRASAEDIVQDAFLGLCRRWDKIPDITYPLAYVRASVLNGCRTAMRRKARDSRLPFLADVPVESAEAHAVLSETVRRLDATAGGSDLAADSQVAWSTTRGCESPLVSGDGSTIVCVSVTGKSPSSSTMTATWLASPVAAPTSLRTLYKVSMPYSAGQPVQSGRQRSGLTPRAERHSSKS